MAARAPKPNGDLFRTLRLKQGLTRERLAQLADCSARKIEDIENSRPTSMTILTQCAAHLGVEDSQVLLSSGGQAKRDTVIVLVISAAKYATLEDAYSAVRPIIDDLSKDYSRVCVEYGSILVTVACSRNVLGGVRNTTWVRNAKKLGVERVEIYRKARREYLEITKTGIRSGQPTRLSHVQKVSLTLEAAFEIVRDIARELCVRNPELWPDSESIAVSTLAYILSFQLGPYQNLVAWMQGQKGPIWDAEQAFRSIAEICVTREIQLRELERARYRDEMERRIEEVSDQRLKAIRGQVEANLRSVLGMRFGLIDEKFEKIDSLNSTYESRTFELQERLRKILGLK